MNLNTEKKRTRGEIACAECRRLKSRCDKQVPCSTCVKRGCEILCPNSTMPPGEGSRFVNVAEEFLRQKILKMEERMHSLEDALAIIQGSALSKPYLPLNDKCQNAEVQWMPEVNHDPVDNEFHKYGLTTAFGSLHLDESGSSDSNISESILSQAKTFLAESSHPAGHGEEEVDLTYLPPEIGLLYQAFPFTPSGVAAESVQDLIKSYLPPLSRAVTLCETFLQSMSWIFSVVSRQHILGELIPALYRQPGVQTPLSPNSYGPHDIALLLIVLAIGALIDPSLPPYNVEGQHYNILSRAALCLQPIVTERSVVTIKTLNLMSIYSGMCGIESKLRMSYSLMDMAARVSLQIGFHRDPSVWGITGREAYERRRYFWILLGGTLWQSLIAGRPPVIMPSLVHCRIPTEEEEDLYESGEVPLGFGSWCFSFIFECLFPIVEVTQGTRPPSYDAVLELDNKIRGFSLPQPSSSKQTIGRMQTSVRSQMRELALLFLHRSFFAQALTEFPSDPLRSPFHQSILSAYQSAIEVLGMLRQQFAHQPMVCAHIWRFWSFAFSAAVVIATVAIKQSSVNLEPEPVGQLEVVCAFFQDAARTSVRARTALPILLCLRRQAMDDHLERKVTPSPEKVHHWGVPDDCEMLVDTRLTHHTTPSMPRPSALAASSDKYIQTPLPPIPYVHQPPAKIAGPEEVERPTGVGWQGPYSGIPSSTSLGPPGLFNVTQAGQSPAYEAHWSTSGPS